MADAPFASSSRDSGWREKNVVQPGQQQGKNIFDDPKFSQSAPLPAPSATPAQAVPPPAAGLAAAVPSMPDMSSFMQSSSSSSGFSTPDLPQQGGAPSGATVASDVPDTSSAALAGLTGAIGMSSGAQEGMPSGQPQEAGGSALRQNLGNRLYPQDSMALAGLRRAY